MAREYESVDQAARDATLGLANATQDQVSADAKKQLTEMYGIASYLFDRYIDRFIDNRKKYPPFGLVSVNGHPITSFESALPFETLRQGIYASFYVDMKPFNDLLNPNDLFEVNAYDRLDKLIKHSLSHKENKINNIRNFFLGGMGTATQYISGLLDAIPRVVKRDAPHKTFTIDNYMEIARNSEGLLVKVASLPMALFGVFDTQTQQAEAFTPESFRFVDESKPRLVLSDDAEKIVSQGKAALRCPAIHRVNGNTSAFHRLWEWTLTLAPDVYETEQKVGYHF